MMILVCLEESLGNKTFSVIKEENKENIEIAGTAFLPSRIGRSVKGCVSGLKLW